MDQRLAGVVGRRRGDDAADARPTRDRGRHRTARTRVITARRTRLHRAPTLPAFRAALAALVPVDAIDRARDTFVLVPTRSAGQLLRRTIEDRALRPGAAIVLPDVLTRRDWYERLHQRTPGLAAAADAIRARGARRGRGARGHHRRRHAAVQHPARAARRDPRPLRWPPGTSADAGAVRGAADGNLQRGGRLRSRRRAPVAPDAVPRSDAAGLRAARGDARPARRAPPSRRPARDAVTHAVSRGHRRGRRPGPGSQRIAGGRLRSPRRDCRASRPSISWPRKSSSRPACTSGCTTCCQAWKTPRCRRPRRSSRRRCCWCPSRSRAPASFLSRDREDELSDLVRRIRAVHSHEDAVAASLAARSQSAWSSGGRCRTSISRGACSPPAACRFSRATRCRWPPSRSPPRWT